MSTLSYRAGTHYPLLLQAQPGSSFALLTGPGSYRSVATNDSAGALSYGPATEPIKAKKPASSSRPPNSTEAYWPPLSEWFTIPGAGLRCEIAMPRASRTKRVFLPSYSPELNLAERVFEEVRRRVEGLVYDSIEDKQAKVESCLRGLGADRERVKRLCEWK